MPCYTGNTEYPGESKCTEITYKGQAHQDSRFANWNGLEGLERFISKFEWAIANPDSSTRKIYVTLEEPKLSYYKNRLKEFVTTKAAQWNILEGILWLKWRKKMNHVAKEKNKSC